jgi:hypothetical protein
MGLLRRADEDSRRSTARRQWKARGLLQLHATTMLGFILVLAQHGLLGPIETPLDISYLSDAVLMLRYFEAAGHVRRALSVVKKRSGHHEQTIREFRLTSHGICLGPPLTNFNGIFSGTPRYFGDVRDQPVERHDE